MTNPTRLVNEVNHICYELPLGKLNKEGTARVLQKPQKGNTCDYYATKRILTDAQIRSEHGRACSARRKQITAAEKNLPPNPSREVRNKIRMAADTAFLKKKGFADPEWSAMEYVLNNAIRSQGVAPETIPLAQKKELGAGLLAQMSALNPAFTSEQMGMKAVEEMFKGHGLEQITYKNLSTIEGWIAQLKAHGPMVVFSNLSFVIYKDPPKELKTQLAHRKLRGWEPGATKFEIANVTHTIVVIGALKENDKSYIYWIDPNDPSDPKNPDSQRIFKSSLAKFEESLRSVNGHLPIATKEKLDGNRNFSIAVYNPHLPLG